MLLELGMFCLLNRIGESGYNRIRWGYITKFYRLCCVVYGCLFFMRITLLSFLTLAMVQRRGVGEVR